LSSASINNRVDPGATDSPPDRLSTDEPFSLVRLAVGSVALLGTVVAILLALATRDPRMLELVGALWAVYGLTVAFMYGVLEPLIDGFFNLLANAGLSRGGSGFSEIEALESQGHHEAAAEAYAERARNPSERVEATLRRSRILAGALSEPESAAVELDSLRAHALSPKDDFRVGMALVDLYEHRLDQPGRAMAELWRLIDRYPTARGARRLRAALRELKSQRHYDTSSS
jgi:hypothetical protein